MYLAHALRACGTDIKAAIETGKLENNLKSQFSGMYLKYYRFSNTIEFDVVDGIGSATNNVNKNNEGINMHADAPGEEVSAHADTPGEGVVRMSSH